MEYMERKLKEEYEKMGTCHTFRKKTNMCVWEKEKKF